MQQSHEEERQAAGAAMHRMEAGMRSQQQTQLAGPPRRAAASSTNPFASMGAPSKEPGSFPDQGDDGDDVFGVGTEQHPTATGDAVSGDGQAEPEGLVTELRGRLAELEAALSSATLARDSAVGEVERLARQCADAETTMHRMEAEMAAENAKLKEELCRMQQSHEEERQAAGAAMHRMEAGMRSQQQTQLAGPPRRAAASSTNPFASMGAPSKEPGSFPDQGDDGDDVFGVGTEQHPTATGDAVSGDGQAEPEGLVTELRGRLAELEAALSSATLARDSAVGEVERLARQCADAEATMHRMEAEMAAENAKLKEELYRMQQSHEEEIEAALLEASDRIAEHDDLLRHKLEEQEAELEARFLEQLNSFKEPGGDSDALHSLLSLKEENAKLKEELCRMQQSHEEERQAAGAAMHRMEAGMRSQQQTQLAGPPRRAAASSTNPFASMGAPSKEPGSFPDQGDDGDDVFGVGTEQHPTATGDAVSGDGQAEPEGLVTELRGRLAELEAALSSATLARDSAVGEVERLARQCADAEATMHRMEAEMAAENAKLKEELCRMQQSHEEEIEAALLEASDRIAEHDDLLRHKLEEQEAELEARFLEQLNSFKEPCGDSDALHSLLSLKEENAKLKEELCRMQQSHEEERQAAGAAMHRMEAGMRSQQQTQLAGSPRRAAASSTNPFASMGAPSKEPGSFPDQGDDGDDVFGVGTEQHPTATGDAVSGDGQAEPEGLVTELRGRLAELEAALSSATLARDSAVGEVERLARQCADAETTMHRMEAEMAAENAKLKEELCRMQQSHEEERQAAGAAMHRMEAGMRSQQQTQLAGSPRRAAASSTNPFASMGAPSKEPGSFPDQGDDGDDVFGVGTEQHPTATGDAVSGDGQAEPEGLVTELRGRLAELEAALSSATLARDSAVGEVERLARQCADAETTMHRMEAEMAAENAKLKEELYRMQQSHEEEIEAALLEASDRIAEHDDLLRHKLEEQEAELEARFLEQLNSFKEPGGDSDALHSLLSLKEENAKLKEELCRMQQSHEEEIEAALLEASDRIAEHDDLLRQKLEEQEEYYEKIIADKTRLESLPVDNSVLGDAFFWKEEHDKLYERFEQLQTELRSYLQDTTVHQDVEAVVRQGTAAEEGTCVDGPLQAALNEVDLLKGQISVLQRTREQEEEKVAMQERDLQELRERLRAEEKSRCEFSQMYEDAAALLRDGATSVEMLLQEKRARIEELESQTEKMSQQVLSTEEQLRFVRVELEQRQQEVDEGTERYFRLEAVHREMGAELREVKRLLEERQRTLSQRLERVQNDMEKQMHDASEEMRRVCCEHEQQENGLRREIDRLRAELQAAQTLAATMPFTAQTNNHQLVHLRQKLDEALSEKMQVVAELEAMQQLLRKKESLSRGRQQGAEDGSEAGDSGQSLDARINSLLQRSESLGVRVQQLTTEKETLLQEKDALELEVQSARRMVEVRELACQRQTDEVKQSRTQIAAMKDDLSFRIQSCNALRQELSEAQEQAAELARAYEDLQLVTFAERRNLLLREYMEAILLAKAMTVPRVMQDVLHGIMQAHRQLLRRFSENQRNLLARCDAIEQTATEAMVEGERQSNELLSIIEDAKAEQQQLQEIIERLEMELAAANRVARESTEEAAAVKKISTEATKDAREEASKAKSDLQALQLEYNSAVNTISLLETEKANAARILARANSRLEELAAQQQEEVARLQESLLEKTCLLRDAQEAAKNKLEAVEQQAEDYKAQRDDATKRAQAAQASLDRVLPRLERLEAEQAAREAELMDTTQQLTALSQRSTSTEVVSRRQVEALNASLAELRSAHAALSEECTKAHEHINELKNQLTASEAEIGRLRTRKAQQEQEAEAAKARLTELESLYANDTSDAATWRRGAERRSAALEIRNSALQEELQASQKQQCVLQEHVDVLEAKLRQMSDENHSKDQQQRRSIQQLKERCEILEGEIGKLDEAHANLSVERDTLHRDWLNAKQDVGSLENHLEATNQHNEQLHKELRRQKESHDAELQMVRRTLADAQEEISRCRCTLVEAEARENELNHVVYALKKEKARCVEELQQMRGLAESEQELLVRERSQRQVQVAELQEEVVQLQKDLHAARQECKGLECKCTQHADEAELLRRQLTDRTDRCRTLQQDAAAQHEQLTATVKSLRAEVATLQSKLEEALDTLAQKQREYEQCEERSLRKMEVSRLSEETLRKEVADLQRDVQQLQQKLAFTATAAHDAEKTGAQQQATIRKLTEELERQNTQSTAYLKEREQLQSALRENTSQLERVARKATADLETALAKTNELHRSNIEKLETALRREQQAAQEVRTARDRALESLEERQGECEFLRAEVARLQQMLRSAQAQVASTQAEVRSTVTQVVVEAGLPQEGELSLSSVVNQLLLRLNRLSHAAVLLDVEVSQFKCFEKACEAHAAALRCVIDATRSSQQVPASSTAPTSPLLPMCESSSGSSTHSLRQRSFSSRSRVLQDIISSVSTFAHRLMDHCHTIRGMLDNMEAAVVQCDTKFVGDPAVTHVKLVVMATLSELQLRTSRQTAFLSQIFDGAVMSTALQEAIRFLRDDETYVLRPFNELLMPSSSSPLSTPRWGGGVQESTFFTTTRVPAADTASMSQHLWKGSAKKENELRSRIVVDPRQHMESAKMPGEEPRGPSIPATSGAEASMASATTAVDASTGPESSSANWCVNHEMQDAA
ncbi:hypothetical protein TcYC6_0022710 [Trypanosoma cruzi]|nr:hypothetical protein TcYC6_0022710 [Trypanosoma cruzi]